jgi:formylglycine-generating enzyme required for sulfatase activity
VRVAAFKLAKTEVTLGQFKQFIQAAGRADLDTAEFRQENRAGDQAPVVHVSWNDAQDFIQWLNRVDGGGYRLPSEAEWEYACRAGRNQRLCGSNDAGPVAWYDDNSDATPHPVATRQPNAWGLHDMSGNAFEWVQDCWHYGYENAPSDARAWVTPCDPLWRVLKGGSWYWDHTYIRATTRITDKNTERNAHFGFRLARSR